MSDTATGILFAVLFPFCIAGLYIIYYINKRQLLGIQALDGKVLLEEAVKKVDRCRRSPVLGNYVPRQSNEYLSFFHYIYVPYCLENPKQQKRGDDTAKAIKIGLLGAGALLSDHAGALPADLGDNVPAAGAVDGMGIRQCRPGIVVCMEDGRGPKPLLERD